MTRTWNSVHICATADTGSFNVSVSTSASGMSWIFFSIFSSILPTGLKNLLFFVFITSNAVVLTVSSIVAKISRGFRLSIRENSQDCSHLTQGKKLNTLFQIVDLFDTFVLFQ